MLVCPCGSKKEYLNCCLPIIAGDKKARTPEQLMRSRYSAYAKKCTDYIYNSYAIESQKAQSFDELSSWAHQTQWLNLEINSTSSLDQPSSTTSYFPTVDFTAYYRHENIFFKMREISRFIFEDLQWRYFDGNIVEHIELPTPKRNDLCLCQSGKKFKQCCINK